MAFWARVVFIRDGELVTRDGTRPKRFSSTLEFSLVSVLREKRKLLLDKLFCPLAAVLTLSPAMPCPATFDAPPPATVPVPPRPLPLVLCS